MRRNSQRRMRRSFHGMRGNSQRMRRSSHGMRRNSQRVMRRPLQRKKWNPQRVAFFFGFFLGGGRREFTARVGQGNHYHHHQPARSGPSVNSQQPLAASPQTPATNTNTQHQHATTPRVAARQREPNIHRREGMCRRACARGRRGHANSASRSARAQRQRSWGMARCKLAGQGRRARAAAAAVGAAR